MSETDNRPAGRDSTYEEPHIDDRVAHRFERQYGRALTGVVVRIEGGRARVMGDGWVEWFPARDLYMMRAASAEDIRALDEKRIAISGRGWASIDRKG